MNKFKPQYQINPYTFAGIPRVLNKMDLNIDSIVDTVCKFYDVTIEQLRTKTRRRDIVKARQMAWAFMAEAGVTRIKSASVFGGFDHTTVIHSIKTISDTKEHDELLNAEYSTMHQQLFKPKMSDLFK